MKVHAQKQKQPQQKASPNTTRSSAKPLAASPLVDSILYLQRTIGNQAVQRLLHANAEGIASGSGEDAPQTESGRRLLSRELTHVVRQEAGVHLKDGMGEAGDAHERHADDVAQAVTAGRPAAPLLGASRSAPVGSGATGPAIQRQVAGNGLYDTYKAAPDATYVAGVNSKQVEPKHAMRGTGKPIDVKVQTFTEMLAAARLPWVGTMHIVGTGLEYFKNHEATQEIRTRFRQMLYEQVEDQKQNSGKLTGTYGAGLTRYGSIWDATEAFSQGLWMIGKIDEPKIKYEVSYSRVGAKAWKANWKAKWIFDDDLDLRPSSKGQTGFYNKVMETFGTIWHEGLGGRDPAPVHMEWEESGSFVVEPLNPNVTPIKSLRPGDVRQW